MSESEALLAAQKKKEKLMNSKFKQQTLPAWRPVPTLKSSLITFLAFGTIFIIIGILLIHFSRGILELSVQYNTKCKSIGTECTITLDVKEKIEAPVFVYYQLDNFYQNHRRYVKSRSLDQL